MLWILAPLLQMALKIKNTYLINYNLVEVWGIVQRNFVSQMESVVFDT